MTCGNAQSRSDFWLSHAGTSHRLSHHVRSPGVSTRFEALAFRAGLPPIRFHDLRHGAASLAKASGADSKYIAALLGHARSSFTDDVYVTLFPEVAKAAAEAAAAVVPRSGQAQ